MSRLAQKARQEESDSARFVLVPSDHGAYLVEEANRSRMSGPSRQFGPEIETTRQRGNTHMPSGALHYWDASWDLRPEECPCDVDFVGWLDENRIVDATIYHFGTGAHHHVGIECARAERRNAVLGITAAPQEYEAFVRLAIQRPDVLRHYNVVFGDIYLLNRKLLPTFDVVTLFHLCEFRGDRNDAYGAMSDLELANLLTDQTRAGGHLLFFPGSFAFDRSDHSAKDVIAEWERQRAVEKLGRYRSLLVYRKIKG